MNVFNSRLFNVFIKYKNYVFQPTYQLTQYSYCTGPVNLEFSSHFPTNQLPVSKIPIIILHGLLGSRLNWRTLANVISLKYQKQVFTLDARNHGESPHSEIFDYPSMASDVVHFMAKQNLEQAILLGHSMGGRAAMTVALSQPDLVEKLIVVDVSPANMPKGSHVLKSFADAMRENLKEPIPENISLTEARRIMNDRLTNAIPDITLRQFILMNLNSSEKGFRWKCNVDVIADKFFSSVAQFPPVNGIYNEETLFICGENSPYVSIDDHEYIKTLFPKAKFIYIPDAGHWVHSEKPQEFLSALGEILGKK